MGTVLAASGAVQSAAAGPAGQPDFVNAAAAVETALSPESLRAGLRRIEADMGRVRTSNRYAARPIDLDVVLYEDLAGSFGELELPDPDLLERAYLAMTVAELDRTARHPVTGERLSEIAERLAGSALLTSRPDIAIEPGAGRSEV